MKFKFTSLALLALALPAYAESTATDMPASPPIPAGHYTLDRAHASLIFRVNHLGFSMYTARFLKFDAQLEFDPQHPENAKLVATVDPQSIQTDYPEPEKLDFNAQIAGTEFLDATKYPDIQFVSDKIELTGGTNAKIHGSFTLHGITKPMVIEAKYNGGWAGIDMDPHARIGFSGHTTLNRSDFGIGYGIPAPGTTMGVSDAVDVTIEAEFNGPPLAQAHQP